MVASVRSTGNRCSPSAATARASRSTAVSAPGWEACPAAPRARSRSPARALLRGGEQVRAAHAVVGRGQRYGEPADLADRLGRAREQLGTVLDQPLRPPDSARLPRRRGTPGPGRGAGRRRSAPWPVRSATNAPANPFMSTAPRPYSTSPYRVVLADLGGERRNSPVRRLDGHDVQMGVHEQRACRPVASRYPHDEVAAPGRRLHVLAGDADLGEPIPHVAGRALLAVADRRRVARVHALDADQYRARSRSSPAPASSASMGRLPPLRHRRTASSSEPSREGGRRAHDPWPSASARPSRLRLAKRPAVGSSPDRQQCAQPSRPDDGPRRDRRRRPFTVVPSADVGGVDPAVLSPLRSN